MRWIADWKCRNGHTMGVVVRMGSGVENLLLYREALDYAPSPALLPVGDGEVEVMAVVVGMARGVRCSICGLERTWVP